MEPSWYEVEELCAAAKRNDLATMTMYLDMQGASIANATDAAGDTALTWSSWCGNTDAMKLLLDYGADINMKGVRGKTPLIWAAEGDRKEAVALLLARGADPDLKDDYGKTALDIARERGNKSVVDIIDGKAAAQRAEAEKLKNEEEGKALTAKRLQELKKNKPPKIKGF